MTDSWWQLARSRGARWGVVALWVLGATLSYSALRDLAVMLGFPEALGDLFPLVIDVAVWVGSMNALEAREHGRRLVERYAWVLVTLYSSGTVAGNALVASAETVDLRLVRALGDGWAHAISGIAHAAPAVTMILFAHLAGLLMTDRPQTVEASTAAVTPAAATGPAIGPEGRGLRSWPAIVDGDHQGPGGHAHSGSTGLKPPVADRPDERETTVAMTAAGAHTVVVELVRQAHTAGRQVTTADVQRLTGRGPRQSRRLLAAAAEAGDRADRGKGRPRLVEADG